MAEEKLKLGKGAAFDKSRLKRLSEAGETWEADFQALPKPIDQSVTHYRGMVVTEEGGSLLSESHVHGRPSVNDLATILANAMRRPLEGKGRRPTLVRLRGLITPFLIWVGALGGAVLLQSLIPQHEVTV